MKESAVVEMDVEMVTHASGLAAIGIAICNGLEKLKNFFSGNHGHSNIHVNGTVHIICTDSIEFSAEEAELAHKILREDKDNLVKDVKANAEAFKIGAEAVLSSCKAALDDGEEIVSKVYNVYNLCRKLDHESDMENLPRYEEYHEALSEREERMEENREKRAAARAKRHETSSKSES